MSPPKKRSFLPAPNTGSATSKTDPTASNAVRNNSRTTPTNRPAHKAPLADAPDLHEDEDQDDMHAESDEEWDEGEEYDEMDAQYDDMLYGQYMQEMEEAVRVACERDPDGTPARGVGTASEVAAGLKSSDITTILKALEDGKVYLMERRTAMTHEQREQMDKRLNTVEVVIDTDKFLEMDSTMHGDSASAGSSKQSNGDPSVPGRRGHKDRGQ